MSTTLRFLFFQFFTITKVRFRVSQSQTKVALCEEVTKATIYF